MKQYETRETSFNEKMTVNFVSYYEGSNFGELQSFPEEHKRGKRHHTTEATEKCS